MLKRNSQRTTATSTASAAIFLWLLFINPVKIFYPRAYSVPALTKSYVVRQREDRFFVQNGWLGMCVETLGSFFDENPEQRPCASVCLLQPIKS